MKWFVRGDVDGFFGLALDNLVQLLVILSLCRFVLGFDDDLLLGRVLPGVAVSLIIGNVFYAWQAKRLGDKLGRDDICALPYGINTPSVFAYIFLVMLPAKLTAMGNGAGARAAAITAWHAGLIACLASGVIEFAGSFIAEHIRRLTPRAALLSTLAGIAIVFISGAFLLDTYAHPIVGLTTLAVILIAYFGRVKFRFGLPAGLIAVAIGIALCWATGLAPGPEPTTSLSLRVPVPVIGDLIEALRSDYLLTYLSVIIPMGIFNVVGSMQNIESAAAEGDHFPTAPSMAVNGIGSIAAALFGSCFPTTIYIGHPGWKEMGARAGYSILNAAFMTAICLTGAAAHIAYVAPVQAGMAIVLWIGIVITAQAFSATPRQHAPAVVVGLLPGIVTWGALMAKLGLRVGGMGPPDGPSFIDKSADILAGFSNAGQNLGGALALEQGFILTAMILAAMVVMIIERRFLAAACWALIAAAISATGLMHGYRWTPADTAIDLHPAWAWVIGYVCMAICLAGARWLTVPTKYVES
ncbi:MAG: NCS2 family permease [Planctomycetes bacterium]|nr:NCS2 family permease [Planctomycetota bacterium]